MYMYVVNSLQIMNSRKGSQGMIDDYDLTNKSCLPNHISRFTSYHVLKYGWMLSAQEASSVLKIQGKLQTINKCKLHFADPIAQHST